MDITIHLFSYIEFHVGRCVGGTFGRALSKRKSLMYYDVQFIIRFNYPCTVGLSLLKSHYSNLLNHPSKMIRTLFLICFKFRKFTLLMNLAVIVLRRTIYFEYNIWGFLGRVDYEYLKSYGWEDICFFHLFIDLLLLLLR